MDPNAPRFLTEAEIKDIISVIPALGSNLREINVIVHQRTIDFIRSSLEKKKVSPLGIPRLKEAIFQKYRSSLASPGTVVGREAGDAIMQVVTQMNFNTHRAGNMVRNTGSSIDTIRELTYATRNIKNPITTIHFKNRHMSHTQVLNLRSEIEECTLSTLLVRREIFDFTIEDEQFEPEWWYAVGPGRFVLRAFESENTTKDDQFSQVMMRMFLNPQLMYVHRITLQEIALIIETKYEMLKVIPSPTHIGILDVYAKTSSEIISKFLKNLNVSDKYSDYVDSRQEDFARIVFSDIAKNTEKTYFKGIKGISNLFPVSYSFWSVVAVRESYDLDNKILTVKLSPPLMKVNSVSLEDISRVLNFFELKYEFQNIENMHNRSQTRMKVANGIIIQDPTGIIGAARSITNLIDGNNIAKRLNTISFAEVQGLNLEAILQLPFVDTRFTISNSMHEAHQVFGIETARLVFMREFRRVMESSGNPVSHRHIQLLADYLMLKGRPLGITYAGVTSKESGFISNSSTERVTEVIQSAAAFGKSESVKSTTVSIILGQLAMIGSRSVKLEPGPTSRKEYSSRARRSTLAIDSDFLSSVDYLFPFQPDSQISTTPVQEMKKVFLSNEGGKVDIREVYEADQRLARRTPDVIAPQRTRAIEPRSALRQVRTATGVRTIETRDDVSTPEGIEWMPMVEAAEDPRLEPIKELPRDIYGMETTPAPLHISEQMKQLRRLFRQQMILRAESNPALKARLEAETARETASTLNISDQMAQLAGIFQQQMILKAETAAAASVKLASETNPDIRARLEAESRVDTDYIEIALSRLSEFTIPSATGRESLGITVERIDVSEGKLKAISDSLVSRLRTLVPSTSTSTSKVLPFLALSERELEDALVSAKATEAIRDLLVQTNIELEVLEKVIRRALKEARTSGEFNPNLSDFPYRILSRNIVRRFMEELKNEIEREINRIFEQSSYDRMYSFLPEGYTSSSRIIQFQSDSKRREYRIDFVNKIAYEFTEGRIYAVKEALVFEDVAKLSDDIIEGKEEGILVQEIFDKERSEFRYVWNPLTDILSKQLRPGLEVISNIRNMFSKSIVIEEERIRNFITVTKGEIESLSILPGKMSPTLLNKVSAFVSKVIEETTAPEPEKIILPAPKKAHTPKKAPVKRTIQRTTRVPLMSMEVRNVPRIPIQN